MKTIVLPRHRSKYGEGEGVLRVGCKLECSALALSIIVEKSLVQLSLCGGE